MIRQNPLVRRIILGQNATILSFSLYSRYSVDSFGVDEGGEYNQILIDKHLVLRTRAQTQEPHSPSLHPGSSTTQLGDLEWETIL